MPVEENGTGQFPSPEDSTAQHSFDDLARGLASGSLSRRRALRLLGGALAGSLMASFPGVARGTERKRDNDLEQGQSPAERGRQFLWHAEFNQRPARIGTVSGFRKSGDAEDQRQKKSS